MINIEISYEKMPSNPILSIFGGATLTKFDI
jgi:hypothetical protein